MEFYGRSVHCRYRNNFLCTGHTLLFFAVQNKGQRIIRNEHGKSRSSSKRKRTANAPVPFSPPIAPCTICVCSDSVRQSCIATCKRAADTCQVSAPDGKYLRICGKSAPFSSISSMNKLIIPEIFCFIFTGTPPFAQTSTCFCFIINTGSYFVKRRFTICFHYFYCIFIRFIIFFI